MNRIESIQLRLADVKARAQLLTEELPFLDGKRLSDAKHDLQACEIMIRHYEGKLAVALAKTHAPESKGDRVED